MPDFLILAPDLSRNAVYPPWQFAGALRAAGHGVRLAGPEPAGPWPPLEAELADALRLPEPWAGWPRAREAARLARGADVIYAFKAMPSSLGVALAARRRSGVPVLLHLDDWDAGFHAPAGWLRRAWYGLRELGTPRGDLWLRWMERRVGDADAVTVSSRALQRRYGGVVIRQGVDTERWSPERYPRGEARERLGVGPSDPMVLFLGTPRPHKGLAGLDAPDLAGALWFVGSGASRLREAGVGEAVLARAAVRGMVPFAESAWYLAASDVFVIPQSSTTYARHQLPAKLLQAMALGCAVVATDVGDARELLGGAPPAGVLVPPDDPAALAEAVRALLEAPHRARALGAEARRRAAAELGWPAMARAVEGVVQGVLGRG